MAKKDSPRKQAKAEKAARREAARRAERRRNLMSLAVVMAVVVVGGALIAVSVAQDRQAEQAAAEELEALQSEAAAEAERIADREVACGAEVPAAAARAEEATPAVTPTALPSPGDILEDGVDYAAQIETSCGTVRIDLAEQEAPETVNNFVSLAQQDFYEGLEIFRNATTIGALQTGSGTNTANFDIGYTIADELGLAEEEGYPPGAVAMANAGPGTAGSQFFFVYNDQFDEAFAENRTFTRFGTVTEGLDVLEQIGDIGTLGPAGETPEELVYMESVEIIENG